uniref:OTU domain-containing protein n=1 Tax=Amphimedon queenslandica TaxID=400682 RepID=A0A1X7UVH2_AMPQE
MWPNRIILIHKIRKYSKFIENAKLNCCIILGLYINPKKDVIFTYEEPPNPDIVRRQRDYVYYPGNEEFQRRWCEILNLKFVTAARILPDSLTTPMSDERVPNSTLDVPGDGNCLFYALSYLITGSISHQNELHKAIFSNMPNFEELFNSTLSATRYSSI